MIPMNYWVANSMDLFNEILTVDAVENGYCYNAKVIRHYIGAPLEELIALCASDYVASKAINEQFGK